MYYGLIALVAIFIALRELTFSKLLVFLLQHLYLQLLSIFLLSEKVGIYRWLAVLIGFVGL